MLNSGLIEATRPKEASSSEITVPAASASSVAQSRPNCSQRNSSGFSKGPAKANVLIHRHLERMCFQSGYFDITRQEKIEVETVLEIIIVGCPRYLLEIETPEWKFFNQKTDDPNVKRGTDRPN